MEENIKVRWLTDNEQNKIAPKTLITQVTHEVLLQGRLVYHFGKP